MDRGARSPQRYSPKRRAASALAAAAFQSRTRGRDASAGVPGAGPPFFPRAAGSCCRRAPARSAARSVQASLTVSCVRFLFQCIGMRRSPRSAQLPSLVRAHGAFCVVPGQACGLARSVIASGGCLRADACGEGGGRPGYRDASRRPSALSSLQWPGSCTFAGRRSRAFLGCFFISPGFVNLVCYSRVLLKFCTRRTLVLRRKLRVVLRGERTAQSVSLSGLYVSVFDRALVAAPICSACAPLPSPSPRRCCVETGLQRSDAESLTATPASCANSVDAPEPSHVF